MLREASKATNITVLRIFAKKDNKFIPFIERRNIRGISSTHLVYVCTKIEGPAHKVKANLSTSLFGNTMAAPFSKYKHKSLFCTTVRSLKLLSTEGQGTFLLIHISSLSFVVLCSHLENVYISTARHEIELI
ncbi:hypothetical protein GQX74_003742 [Glossina fuscipes]|nr:hypothetical protein GQX74_003742 [Glossina fuscipes]